MVPTEYQLCEPDPAWFYSPAFSIVLAFYPMMAYRSMKKYVVLFQPFLLYQRSIVTLVNYKKRYIEKNDFYENLQNFV